QPRGARLRSATMPAAPASIEQLFGLRGRVAIVTGASSGLGVEFADALACAGADVALLARRADRLEQVATDLRSRHGVRALPVEVDITDRDAAALAFSRIAAELGPAW